MDKLNWKRIFLGGLAAGLIPFELLAIGSVVALAEHVLGTLVGARLYREAVARG